MSISSQEELLAQAQQICQQRNVRFTPQRLEVLRLIANQAGATSAYDLLDLLRQSEPQAKPPTIYRALNFLLEQGFIHKVESTNSYVFCHHFNEPHHASALFICLHCGDVNEHAIPTIQADLIATADRVGFALQHSVIEAHGLCQSCQLTEPCLAQTCHQPG